MKLKIFIYKWLPIVFGCHCKSSRSFFYNGKQFPICARCTGEAVGIIFSIFLFFFYTPSVKIAFLLMFPMIIDGFIQMFMIIDGFIQMFLKYESTNIRRFTTGFLFGIGLMTIFVVTTKIALSYGINIGKNIAKKIKI